MLPLKIEQNHLKADTDCSLDTGQVKKLSFNKVNELNLWDSKEIMPYHFELCAS